jgi:DNA-binding transcriptional LysR family regulator
MRFRLHYPAVDVEVTAMETPTQLEALRDGLIDVGFLRPRAQYPPGVSARVVHREPLLLALAANHPLAAKRLEVKHLAEPNFIIPQFDENTGFAEHLAQLAAQGGFAPQKIVRVRDFLTAITLAAGGYGVVPAPRCVASIAMRNVIFKPIQGGAPAELVIAHRERRACAAVAAFAKEALAPLPAIHRAARRR